MTLIKTADLIESVADALQFISYYHPMDYIRALGAAYEAEANPAAKDAIAQILTNSRMCAEGHRPICQDTAIVNVFVKWGMDCRLDDNSRSMQEVIDEGVRRAYLNPENRLRACQAPGGDSPTSPTFLGKLLTQGGVSRGRPKFGCAPARGGVYRAFLPKPAARLWVQT